MLLTPVEEMRNANMTIAAPARSGTDEKLVAAAKAGDELSFETIFRRYESRVFSIALRYTRVHEDAEDIVQQTFQKVFVYLHRFQGKSAFSTWLTRIAINESLMFLRKGRVLRELPIEDSPSEETARRVLEIHDSRPTPEMSYLQQEGVESLSSAIAQLSPALRTAIELKELRELTGSDTARHMGVSLSAVKARVFHGREKLRKILRSSLRARRVSRSTVLAIASKDRYRRVA